ncbi:MAG: hypothetical protein AB7O96_09890, partial [Pseudobdellovibrionaceae bacterium]
PNGNVGIGTTTPAYRLDSTGGFFRSTFNTTTVPPSDNGNGGLAIGWNRSAGSAEVNFYNIYDSVGAAGGYQFSQKTGASTYSDLMSILATGDVHIKSNLLIGNGASTGDTTMEVGQNRTGNGNAYFDLHSSAGSDYDARIIKSTGVNGNLDIVNLGTGNMNLNQAGAGNLTLNVNGAERMRIDSTGRVGIGTSAPDQALVVRSTGNSSIKVASYSGTSANLSLDSDTYASISAPNSSLGIHTGGSEHLRISSTGNVGIGTTTPVEKLDVAGGIKLGDSASSCDSSHRGVMKFVAGGGGIADKIYSCLLGSDGTTYAWVELASGSGGCGGTSVGGYCWYLGASGADCTATCASHGGYNSATDSYAGSGDLSGGHCDTITTAFGATWDEANDCGVSAGIGCIVASFSGMQCTEDAATASGAYTGVQRVCACNN